MNLGIRVSNSNGPFSTPMSQPAPRPWVDVSYIASSPFGYDIARSSISKNEPEWEDMHFKVYKRQAAYRKSKHTCGHCGGWGLRMCSALPASRVCADPTRGQMCYGWYYFKLCHSVYVTYRCVCDIHQWPFELTLNCLMARIPRWWNNCAQVSCRSEELNFHCNGDSEKRLNAYTLSEN